MTEILEIADQAAYFPNVKASGGSLLAAISRAIAKAEGPMGANRQLGITEYIEAPVLESNTLFLEHGPLVVDANGIPDLGIEARLGIGADGFSRSPSYGTGIKYQPVDPTLYEVDTSSGEILFSSDAGMAFVHSYVAVGFRRTHGFSTHYDSAMPTSENLSRSQVRVRYKAGYDFSSNPLSRDARAVKALVAELMIADDGISAMGNIKKEVIVDFHSYEYSADGFQSRAANALMALKQFC